MLLALDNKIYKNILFYKILGEPHLELMDYFIQTIPKLQLKLMVDIELLNLNLIQVIQFKIIKIIKLFKKLMILYKIKLN